jgi:excinuclease ABC subunit A
VLYSGPPAGLAERRIATRAYLFAEHASQTRTSRKAGIGYAWKALPATT